MKFSDAMTKRINQLTPAPVRVSTEQVVEAAESLGCRVDISPHGINVMNVEKSQYQREIPAVTEKRRRKKFLWIGEEYEIELEPARLESIEYEHLESVLRLGYHPPFGAVISWRPVIYTGNIPEFWWSEGSVILVPIFGTIEGVQVNFNRNSAETAVDTARLIAKLIDDSLPEEAESREVAANGSGGDEYVLISPEKDWYDGQFITCIDAGGNYNYDRHTWYVDEDDEADTAMAKAEESYRGFLATNQPD